MQENYIVISYQVLLAFEIEMTPRARAKRPEIVRHEIRGIPRQKRSQATVRSIKQATLELSRQDGFISLSTNRIADHAGVSIGTLYQYFSTVESILISLFEDSSVEFAEATKALMVSALEEPVRTAVPAVIDRLLKMHARHREILLRLPAERPELKLVERPMAFDNLVRGGIKTYLEWHFPKLNSREINRKVFFLEQVELGSIRRYLLDPPAQMTRQEFIADLSSLVVAYIEGIGQEA